MLKKEKAVEEEPAEKRELKKGANQGVESAPERGVNRGVERGVNYRRPPAPAKPSTEPSSISGAGIQDS